MLSSSRLEAIACRFDPVVTHLRSFLKDNGVAYGFPEHLLSFTDRVTDDESLRYALSSKLHTLVADLPATTSHGDLVEVLLLSVGGFAIDEDTPPMQKAERVLSRLCGEVLTSPHTLSPGPPPLAPLPAPPTAPMSPPMSFLKEQPALLTTSPEPAPIAEVSPMLEAVPSLPTWSPAVESKARPSLTNPAGTPAFAAAFLAHLPKRPAASPSFAWTPAPRFVWAALVCGLLFPPGMYLISQPHAASSSPLQHRARAAHPAVISQPGQTPRSPVQSTELDRQTDEDLASIAALGFGSSAGQRQVALARLRELRSGPTPTSQATATNSPSPAKKALEADLTPRETDMPGRDLSSLVPAPPSSPSAQQELRPKP